MERGESSKANGNSNSDEYTKNTAWMPESIQNGDSNNLPIIEFTSYPDILESARNKCILKYHSNGSSAAAASSPQRYGSPSHANMKGTSNAARHRQYSNTASNRTPRAAASKSPRPRPRPVNQNGNSHGGPSKYNHGSHPPFFPTPAKYPSAHMPQNGPPPYNGNMPHMKPDQYNWQGNWHASAFGGFGYGGNYGSGYMPENFPYSGYYQGYQNNNNNNGDWRNQGYGNYANGGYVPMQNPTAPFGNFMSNAPAYQSTSTYYGPLGNDMFLSAGSYMGTPTISAPAEAVIPPAAPEPSLSTGILRQIEYYFSDANLVGDYYLKSKMDDEGWVPITLIAEFRRIKSMTSDIQFILDSLKDSETIEVQGDKLRRRNEWIKWICR